MRKRIGTKRLSAALATLFAVAALPLALAATAEGGAVVEQSGPCMFSNAGDTIEVSIDSTAKQKVTTQGGNIVITCHFTAADITLGAPSKFSESGFVCTVSGVETTDSHFTMTAQGRATLHCVARV